MEFANIPIFIALFLSLYLVVLSFLAFFEEEEKDVKIKSYKFLPKVAVIVPAYNEGENVLQSLKSLQNLKYPKSKLTIYAVDDGSKDNTLQVMLDFAEDKKHLKILTKENGGKASAVNYALKRIPNDVKYVGVLDADSFVKENALLEIIKEFEKDSDIQAVTPAIKIYNPDRIIRFLQNAEYALSIWIRKSFANLGVIFIIPGPFSFYKKTALDKLGYFKHAHGTEDLEMGMRFQNANMKISNTSKAVVYTVSPNTVYKLYKQRLRWSYGFLNNAIEYKRLFFRKNALGILILPSAILGIILTFYIFLYTMFNLFNLLIDKIVNIYYFGFNFNLDLFYINFSLIGWLSIIILSLGTYAIVLGDMASEERSVRLKDILSYLFLYNFIAPLWLFAASFKTLLKSEVKWVKVNK